MTRLPVWARVLLALLAAGAALLAAGALWLYAAFSGGLDELLDVSDPSPSDRAVVEATQRSEGELAESARALAGADPGVGTTCYEGQHNWKIDDPYDLRCTTQAGAVVAGEQPYPDAALALHARLVAEGWVPRHGDQLEDRSSLAWVLAQYGPDPAAGPAAEYLRGDVALVVEPLAPGETTPYGWPGPRPPVRDGWALALVLSEESFAA